MMLRTLALAGILTLIGASASDAQYRDSYPPEEQYESEYNDDDPYPGYDRELLGDPDEYGYYDDEGDYDRGYSEPDIDVGIFASLGSHGRWHFAANFGWVWRPYAVTGWRPYSHGRWVWTNYGWTWVSYEPYGWATYHYGYWHHDPFMGWVWIPGYEWSASRVSWAYYDNYVAWAPLPPPGYYCPNPWSPAGISVWITIGADRFCDPYPYHHYVTPKYKSVYRERVAYKAPAKHYVERYSGSPVRNSTVEFRHKSFTKGGSTSAKFTERGGSSKGAKVTTSPQRIKSGKSRDFGSQVRTFDAPKSVNRSQARVTKSKGGNDVRRESPKSFTQKSRPSFNTRERVAPQREMRESRMTRNERQAPSRSFTKSKAPREQRSIQRAERVERSKPSLQRAERTERSRPSFQASRGSSGGERKSVSPQTRTAKRDVAKVKGSRSEKGRGKAR